MSALTSVAFYRHEAYAIGIGLLLTARFGLAQGTKLRTLDFRAGSPDEQQLILTSVENTRMFQLPYVPLAPWCSTVSWWLAVKTAGAGEALSTPQWTAVWLNTPRSQSAAEGPCGGGRAFTLAATAEVVERSLFAFLPPIGFGR